MTDQFDLFLALQESLTLLASSGLRQMQYVKNLDLIAGRPGAATNHAIARQFVALAPQFTGMAAAGTITSAMIRRLEGIFVALQEMESPAGAHLWTDEALTRAEEWTRLRSLAAGALRQLRLPYAVPSPPPG